MPGKLTTDHPNLYLYTLRKKSLWVNYNYLINMSLKQEEVIRRLPQNGFNIAKTFREVGYSEASSRAGTTYAALRKRMQKAYDPETIKASIQKAAKEFRTAEDRSNYARMLELMAKIAGLTKDNGNTQVTAIFPGVVDKAKQIIDIDTTDSSQQSVDK